MGTEPENTLRSFAAAQQAGLDVIELDLHLSKDGALVVMHDTDVDRTTDGTGPIAEIGRLVPGVRTALIGSRFGPDIVERAVEAGAGTVCLNIRRLTLEVVEAARKADLKIIGWVVNTQDHLKLVRALELDGATTDYPEIKRTGRFTA